MFLLYDEGGYEIIMLSGIYRSQIQDDRNHMG